MCVSVFVQDTTCDHNGWCNRISSNVDLFQVGDELGYVLWELAQPVDGKDVDVPANGKEVRVFEDPPNSGVHLVTMYTRGFKEIESSLLHIILGDSYFCFYSS